MYTSPKSTKAKAFTLIEILVVVAIIALLVSILMPALKMAKEQTKATICLSNLKQQGIGFAAYANDNKAYLPWAGRFKYYMAAAKWEVGLIPRKDWAMTGNGCLYPKYIGQTVDIFYCPSNIANNRDDPRGADGQGRVAFLNRYKYRRKQFDQPNYRAADPGNYPWSGYAYGLPLAEGHWPRLGGKTPYPESSMTYADGGQSQFLQYMKDPQEWPQAASVFGPCPQKTRGKSSVQALLTDCYFSGMQGYHINGWNVLFSDFHAKRVNDPNKKLFTSGFISGTGGYNKNWSGPLAYYAWDFFSKRQ